MKGIADILRVDLQVNLSTFDVPSESSLSGCSTAKLPRTAWSAPWSNLGVPMSLTRRCADARSAHVVVCRGLRGLAPEACYLAEGLPITRGK